LNFAYEVEHGDNTPFLLLCGQFYYHYYSSPPSVPFFHFLSSVSSRRFFVIGNGIVFRKNGRYYNYVKAVLPSERRPVEKTKNKK